HRRPAVGAQPGTRWMFVGRISNPSGRAGTDWKSVLRTYGQLRIMDARQFTLNNDDPRSNDWNKECSNVIRASRWQLLAVALVLGLCTAGVRLAGQGGDAPRQPGVDAQGDATPPAALARLGTLRL